MSWYTDKTNHTGYPDYRDFWSLYTRDHGLGLSVLDFNTKNGPQLQTVTAAGLNSIMAHEPRQYPSFPRKPLGWSWQGGSRFWFQEVDLQWAKHNTKDFS